MSFWNKVEKYEKHIASVVIAVSVVVLLSAVFNPVDIDEGEVVNSVEDIVVNVDTKLAPIWNIFVVKNGDCYSIGDDEGWVYGSCWTLEDAKEHVASLKAANALKREQQARPWVRVGE